MCSLRARKRADSVLAKAPQRTTSTIFTSHHTRMINEIVKQTGYDKKYVHDIFTHVYKPLKKVMGFFETKITKIMKNNKHNKKMTNMH